MAPSRRCRVFIVNGIVIGSYYSWEHLWDDGEFSEPRALCILIMLVSSSTFVVYTWIKIRIVRESLDRRWRTR
jgi:hypothetical protein